MNKVPFWWFTPTPTLYRSYPKWVPLLGTGKIANVLSSLSNLEISHPAESS